MHGAFSANLDRPARVRSVVIKAGKPQGCLPASFDFRCRGRCSSRQESTETYLILMYVSTRGTRDGGLYTCRRSPKTDRRFVRSRSQNPRPFSCRCKRGAKATHPASPVSRASRYNTLHLASKVVCQRGDTPPFGTPPGLVDVWGYSPHLRPIPPPLQKPKKRSTSARGRLTCSASLFGLRAGTGENTWEKLRFRVAFFKKPGYNKINPNRRLQYERSG